MSCEHRDRLHDLVLGLAAPDAERVVGEHVGKCTDCRAELESLRATVDAFTGWPTDVLRPSTSLWSRLVARVAPDADGIDPPNELSRGAEPEWRDVAPGIACKLLAADPEHDMLTMLVRLAPGAAYPAHTHARFEELHLLDGELWIDERKLLPGDYNRAEAGTSDQRVWSATGCTCVLVTSTQDLLR